MEYQLTEAQKYFDADWKYRLTLKYGSHINRTKEGVNEDLIHLRNRVRRKLFGRKGWILDWLPVIEKGEQGRNHIHLYLGEIPDTTKRIKRLQIGYWFPYWIREEWETLTQSTKSKNNEVRSHIRILDDRKNTISYGTKTFLDSSYNTLIDARNNTTDYRERQDIQKEINELRNTDLFSCIADWYFLTQSTNS